MPWPLQLDPVRTSAVAASLGWAAGSAGLLLAPRSLLARVGWAAGWVVAAAHVAIALHVAHGWSHAAAVAHAERTAGFGPGVFVNEAFLLIWGIDAGWRLLAPDRAAGRPRWVGWAVHGFLAFIVFNATVVYGSGGAKVVGGVMFVGLAALAWGSHPRVWCPPCPVRVDPVA